MISTVSNYYYYYFDSGARNEEIRKTGAAKDGNSQVGRQGREQSLTIRHKSHQLGYAGAEAGVG